MIFKAVKSYNISLAVSTQCTTALDGLTVRIHVAYTAAR